MDVTFTFVENSVGSFCIAKQKNQFVRNYLQDDYNETSTNNFINFKQRALMASLQFPRCNWFVLFIWPVQRLRINNSDTILSINIDTLALCLSREADIYCQNYLHYIVGKYNNFLRVIHTLCFGFSLRFAFIRP